MSLDLSPAIRDALMDAVAISSQLADWKGEPSIHTRRPLPADVTYPCIAISPDVTIYDADGLKSERPIVERDVTAYGLQPDQYRTVEALGHAIRQLFHRQKWSIRPDGYDVIDVQARGPMPAPTDDEKKVGRVVTLTIRLRRA